MLNIIKSEQIKYKRTVSKKLIYIAPLFFVIYAAITFPITSSVDYYVYTVFNWWPLLFMPLGTALLSSLSITREKKSGNDKAIRCHDISMMRFWLGKVIVIAFYLLLSTLVLLIILLLFKIILPDIITSVFVVITASFTIWLTSLIYIPITLFLAEQFGMVLSIIVSVTGIVSGVVMASESYWVYNPWSWGMRLMAPIVGVHPNGVPLENGNSLLDPSVIPTGIIVSVCLFICLSYVTAFWFSKKEVN